MNEHSKKPLTPIYLTYHCICLIVFASTLDLLDLPSSSHTSKSNSLKSSIMDSDVADDSWLCGTCDGAVNWSHKGLACNTCGQWFHAHCQSLDTQLYEHQAEVGEDVSWHCAICGSPNSQTALDLHGVTLSVTTPTTSSLRISETHSNVNDRTDASVSGTVGTPNKTFSGRPLHMSTPTKAYRQNKQKKKVYWKSRSKAR